MEIEETIKLIAQSYFWCYIITLILMFLLLLSNTITDDLNRTKEVLIKNGKYRIFTYQEWFIPLFLFILSIKLK